MGALQRLFKKLTSSERRKADRIPSPNLGAYYWTNAAPKAHSIRDISSTGLYLITDERWYPGTLVMVTLQKKTGGDEGSEQSLAVQSKAVRWGADGVGLEFILSNPKDSGKGQSVLKDGADRKALEKFLAGFEPEDGEAIVNYLILPIEATLA
jgi:hypothetical protein